MLELSCCDDSVISQRALQVLDSAPSSVLSNTVRTVAASRSNSRRIVSHFSEELLPSDEMCIDAPCPQSLCMLDDSRFSSKAEVRVNMVELLLHNSSFPVPSLTSWICGYSLHADPHSLLTKPNALESIVKAVNDKAFCEKFPQLAARYVQLIYVLTSNGSTATEGLRQTIHSRDGQGYLETLYEISAQSTPSEVLRFAFSLRSIALELFDTGCVTDLLDLHLRRLFPFLSGDEALTKNFPSQSRKDETDFLDWPHAILSHLPDFPSLAVPGGVRDGAVLLCDGVPQYDIATLCWAFRSTNQDSASCTLKSQLEPFVCANSCLVAYGAAVEFIEGWCQVVELACMKRRGWSLQKLVAFLKVLIEAISDCRKLTSGLQQRAVEALSRAIATVATALHGLLRQAKDENSLGALQLVIVSLLQSDHFSVTIRSNLYTAIYLLMTSLREPCELVTLQKYHVALFPRIVQDVCWPSKALQSIALRVLQCVCSNSSLAVKFCADNGGSNLARSMSAFLSMAEKGLEEVFNGGVMATDAHHVASMVEGGLLAFCVIDKSPTKRFAHRGTCSCNGSNELLGCMWSPFGEE